MFFKVHVKYCMQSVYLGGLDHFWVCDHFWFLNFESETNSPSIFAFKKKDGSALFFAVAASEQGVTFTQCFFKRFEDNKKWRCGSSETPKMSSSQNGGLGRWLWDGVPVSNGFPGWCSQRRPCCGAAGTPREVHQNVIVDTLMQGVINYLDKKLQWVPINQQKWPRLTYSGYMFPYVSPNVSIRTVLKNPLLHSKRKPDKGFHINRWELGNDLAPEMAEDVFLPVSMHCCDYQIAHKLRWIMVVRSEVNFRKKW